MSEKDYNPNMKENKSMAKQTKTKKMPVDVPKEKVEVKEVKTENKETVVAEEVKVPEKKKEKKVQPAVKKDSAVVNGQSINLSTKYAVEICRFIRGKKIDTAIGDLEMVINKKRAVPMRGEYGHKKGIAGGRYPKQASEKFIMLLKSLQSNVVANGVENAIVFEASANKAQSPFGRGGIKRKRTHVRLIAKSKKGNKK